VVERCSRGWVDGRFQLDAVPLRKGVLLGHALAAVQLDRQGERWRPSLSGLEVVSRATAVVVGGLIMDEQMLAAVTSSSTGVTPSWM
jgi:hypothetical protein